MVDMLARAGGFVQHLRDDAQSLGSDDLWLAEVGAMQTSLVPPVGIPVQPVEALLLARGKCAFRAIEAKSCIGLQPGKPLHRADTDLPGARSCAGSPTKNVVSPLWSAARHQLLPFEYHKSYTSMIYANP